ncbi:MAG: PDZ domain-containing protein [Candidatus Aminicenantes bacterium]|nr:PDZ domain-containing protein [Candidatus Aminicenantes bacterium]NIM84959.1 PDZ domain-containing protein [Candidatus Aminicenantes bacterium]NIN24473.1 PDZ domain-containing protein [Candidatus Aminicenantes bacterium]NIN48237.1 PDZ domain-containing protein [Candidatus Aminicenantes bacterium]NIN91140.1 PDZ domain-containing protein [Candidatus Aminicenantes bacterium]
MTQLKRLFVSKKMMTGLIVVLSLILVGTGSTLMAGKDSGRGYLGVMVENLSKEDKEELGLTHGVRVTKVIKDQAAEKAGIKKGDIIQYFNDEKIRRPSNLVDAVREVKPKTQVKVKLVRDGKNKELTVTLGKLKSGFQWFGIGGDKNVLFVSTKGGYLGVQLHEMDKDLAGYFGLKEDEGALILKVEEDSPAEKAGLKSGDVIVQVDKEKIEEPDDVSDILRDMEEGDEVQIQVIRHKKKKTVKAELDERPGWGRLGIFKGDFDKIRSKFPLQYFYFNMPHQDDDDVIILKKKLKKKAEKAKEKAEKAKKKLKKLKEKEYIYI